MIGAGSVGKAAARVMANAGASCLMVASRRIASARQTASEVGGQAVDMDQLLDALSAADLVITATSAPHLILHTDVIKDALVGRGGRPLVIVDVAVLASRLEGGVPDLSKSAKAGFCYVS